MITIALCWRHILRWSYENRFAYFGSAALAGCELASYILIPLFVLWPQS